MADTGTKIPKGRLLCRLASFVRLLRCMWNTAKKILIVDSNDAFRESIRTFIKGLGHQVFEAATGLDAIEKASSLHPDLIIMDIRMPGLNGLDATRRIREYQSLQRTPIVAVSAYGAADYRAKAINAGCDEYVSTPFEPEALGELIKRLLAQ